MLGWDIDKLFNEAIKKKYDNSEFLNQILEHSSKHRCLENLKKEIISCGVIFDRQILFKNEEKQKSVQDIIDFVAAFFGECVIAERKAIVSGKGFTKLELEDARYEKEIAGHEEYIQSVISDMKKTRVPVSNSGIII